MNTMAQAKRDFQMGYLTVFSFERAMLTDGWLLVLGAGMSKGPLLDARTKQPRVFKTLDSVLSSAEQIGFEINFLSNQ